MNTKNNEYKFGDYRFGSMASTGVMLGGRYGAWGALVGGTIGLALEVYIIANGAEIDSSSTNVQIYEYGHLIEYSGDILDDSDTY